MSSERLVSVRQELSIRKYRGVDQKCRAGRLKVIVVCKVDVVDDLERRVFKEQVRPTYYVR